jgi:hypothetical protein
LFSIFSYFYALVRKLTKPRKYLQIKKETSYNYALDVNPLDPGKNCTVEKNPLTTPWCWQLEYPPFKLRVPAVQFNWRPTDLQPLPEEPVRSGEKKDIELVPYNLTKFRVSMFPVSEESWHGGN